MNHLNYNTYIKQIDTENSIEFECEESDMSDYSDYSDTTNTIVYEDHNVSLLAANHIDTTHTNYLENTFVDVELDEHRDDDPMDDDTIEEDGPISLKEKLRDIHNRQKNIICTTLKCAIL
tara:strand:- start:38 stop:397 length:360 start_codon:yes stop_codon:yes gene_type:complete